MSLKNNKGAVLEDVIERVERAVEDKKAGATCQHCGAPIWAIGSSIVGNGSFICITGDSDHLDDYEIDEVCWK